MTNTTNTPAVSFRPVAKALAVGIVDGDRTPEELLVEAAKENGADELRVPSDLSNYGQVPAAVSYRDGDGENVHCTVVADGQPMATVYGAAKLDREIREARAAETQKPKKPKVKLSQHFATRYQSNECRNLVFGDAGAVEAAARAISEKAASRGANVVVVPAQAANDTNVQNALAAAGLNCPSSGVLPKWSADPNWTAQAPRKPKNTGKRNGSRGNGNRPQKKQGYVQPGTGKSVNPYAGMPTWVAKHFSPAEAAKLTPGKAKAIVEKKLAKEAEGK